MEIRKVQLTGGSSYVITLPKEWIKGLGIKKNDSLGLVTQPDGSLLVTTRTTEGRTHRSKDIKVDEVEEPAHLFRLLIGAYIMGYSTINVRSQGRISPTIRDTVMRFAQVTIGPEIMEEGPQYITIRDLLNPAEMPFDKTVKRMHLLVRTMHEDSMTVLENRDRALAEDVEKRDGDVNRLHWLIARQSNIMLNDIALARKMGITLEEASIHFLISRILERIGDHGARISRMVIKLLDGKFDSKLQFKILQASKASLSLLGNSLDTWFKKDLKAANRNIDSVKDLEKQCDAINNDAKRVSSVISIPATDISDSIRRTGEYAADISELVINSLISDIK